MAASRSCSFLLTTRSLLSSRFPRLIKRLRESSKRLMRHAPPPTIALGIAAADVLALHANAMRFAPTDEQLLIQNAARDFAEREIAPKAMELDKTGRWPTEIVDRMAELGFLGMMVPNEYGGAGLDKIAG